MLHANEIQVTVIQVYDIVKINLNYINTYSHTGRLKFKN